MRVVISLQVNKINQISNELKLYKKIYKKFFEGLLDGMLYQPGTVLVDKNKELSYSFSKDSKLGDNPVVLIVDKKGKEIYLSAIDSIDYGVDDRSNLIDFYLSKDLIQDPQYLFKVPLLDKYLPDFYSWKSNDLRYLELILNLTLKK